MAFAVAGMLAACQKPQMPAPVHYTVGAPYQASGRWYYPQEDYAYDQTGLATVYPAGHGGLTADGERYGAGTLAAAHPTLQLPAIARVTDLESGRQILLRINDRGPEARGRLLAVTPRAAVLLGIGAAPAQVRVEVVEADSRAAAEAVGGGTLPIDAAPREAVSVETLATPGAAPAQQVLSPAPANPQSPPAAAAIAAPQRLPETVLQTEPAPGQLWVDGSSFGRALYAGQQRQRLADVPAEIVRESTGRGVVYRVRVGPLASVTDADAMLDRVLAAGVTDARIAVEQ